MSTPLTSPNKQVQDTTLPSVQPQQTIECLQETNTIEGIENKEKTTECAEEQKMEEALGESVTEILNEETRNSGVQQEDNKTKEVEEAENRKRLLEKENDEKPPKKKRVAPQIVDEKEIKMDVEPTEVVKESEKPEENENNDEELMDIDVAQQLDTRLFVYNFEIGNKKEVSVDQQFKKWLEEQNISVFGENWEEKFKKENEEVFVKGVENEEDEEEEEEEEESVDTNKEDIIEDDNDFEGTKKRAEERKERRENPYTSIIGKLQQKLFVQQTTQRGYGYDMEDNFIDDGYSYSLPRFKTRPEIKIEEAGQVKKTVDRRNAIKAKKTAEKEAKEEKSEEAKKNENTVDKDTTNIAKKRRGRHKKEEVEEEKA